MVSARGKRTVPAWGLLACAVAALAPIGGCSSAATAEQGATQPPSHTTPAVASAASKARAQAPEQARHPVEIHIPDALRGIQTGEVDARGKPLLVPCGTCHEGEPHSLRGSDDPPVQGPHRGLQLQHGQLQCAACHHREQAQLLHTADGSPLPLTEAMVLCGQCHGPQMRDYRHGSHGGMNGYWDLRKGPRLRNHCIDCHDPHAPAYPRYTPAPPPKAPRRHGP